MDEKELDKVTAFDTLFTTNHIQMMKVFSSYLPSSLLQQLAIYIKTAELQYTLQLFRRHPSISLSSHRDPPDSTRLCDELTPYCSPSEKEQLQKMKNMMEQFKSMQDMMEMMKLMQELSDTDDSNKSNDSSDSQTSSQGGFPFPDNLADIFSMLSDMPGLF